MKRSNPGPDGDRLADVRAAVGQEVSDPEEQRQLMALADGLDRHYRGRQRGAWVFTAGVAAAAAALLVGGTYMLLNRPLAPVSPAGKGSVAPLAVAGAVPMATEVPAAHLVPAYRPAGLAPNTLVGLMATKLGSGSTAVLVWNMQGTAAPLEEVVVPAAHDLLVPSVMRPAWWFVTSRKVAAQGPSWATARNLIGRQQPPALAFVALPSGSFPGLPTVPIHYAAGVSHFTGGRLLLVQVKGLDPSYWLVNTNGQVVAVGPTLAEPLSSYGPVQHGLAALERLVGL